MSIPEPTTIAIPIDTLTEWIMICDEIETPVVAYDPEALELAKTVYYSNRDKASKLKRQIMECLQ